MPQKLFCNIVAQKGMFQYQSVPFYRHHINSFCRQMQWQYNRLQNKKKKHVFLFVHVYVAAAGILESVLFETVSVNFNKTCRCRWGNRHIADMHREPAFLLVLEFPLLTGSQQSVVRLSSARSSSRSRFSVPSLCSDGPPGSSCFCAGLRQKPYVSSSTKQ